MADDRLQGFELQVIGETAFEFGPNWTEENLEKVRVIIAKTASIIRAEKLDRPDREKIAQLCCDLVDHGQDRTWEQLSEGEREDYREDADQILALIPDVDTGEIESLFADGTTHHTFIRGRDNRSSVEECYLILKSEWQALKSKRWKK